MPISITSPETRERTGGKPKVLAVDIDGVVAPLHETYSHVLGTPVEELGKTEAEIAAQHGISLGRLYTKKDDYLKSKEALSIPPIEGAREMLGVLQAAGYTPIFVTARIPEVKEHTRDWLELKLGDVLDEINVITIGTEAAAGGPPNKRAAYREIGAVAAIDDTGHHLGQALRAGVRNRILFRHGATDQKRPSRRQKETRGTHFAGSWHRVGELLLPQSVVVEP